jgi:tetratricopeptide (TPR) repeat protein
MWFYALCAFIELLLGLLGVLITFTEVPQMGYVLMGVALLTSIKTCFNFLHHSYARKESQGLRQDFIDLNSEMHIVVETVMNLASRHRYQEELLSQKLADPLQKEVETLFEKACHLMEKQWHHEASLQFQLLLKIHPQSLVASYNLGITLGKVGRFEESISYFQKVVQTDPTFPGVYNNLGISFTKIEAFEEALNAYEKARLYEPQNAKILNNMAEPFYHKAQWFNAISCYEEAIRLDPHYLLPYKNLSKIYLEQGGYEKALPLLQQALTLHPHHTELYVYLGKVYFRLEVYENAREMFEKAAQLSPEKYGDRINVGVVLLRQGVFESALALFKTAQAQGDSSIELDFCVGRTHFALKHYPEALEAYERILEKDKNFAPAWVNGGATLYLLGDLDQALRYLKQAVSLAPTMPKAHYNLSCFYTLKKNIPKALFHLKKALACGYSNIPHVFRDPDLALLREKDEFWKLFEKEASSPPLPAEVENF